MHPDAMATPSHPPLPLPGHPLQALLLEAQSEQYLKSDEPDVSIPYRPTVAPA